MYKIVLELKPKILELIASSKELTSSVEAFKPIFSKGHNKNSHSRNT